MTIVTSMELLIGAGLLENLEYSVSGAVDSAVSTGLIRSHHQQLSLPKHLTTAVHLPQANIKAIHAFSISKLKTIIILYIFYYISGDCSLQHYIAIVLCQFLSQFLTYIFFFLSTRRHILNICLTCTPFCSYCYCRSSKSHKVNITELMQS